MTNSRILISQPAPAVDKKSPFSVLTERYSIDVDFKPLITVERISVQDFISQRVKILEHTAVIFTSRALIDHFFRLVADARVSIPDTMKYFCISEAVALYLQKYIVYRKRKVFFAAGSVNSLMELILKYSKEKYFLPLSSPYKPELPSAMEYAAIPHSKAVISNTVCRDTSDIDPTIYSIIALYSPIEVNNFKSAFLDRGFTGQLAVFGEATAKAALAQELTIDIMAPNPKYPSMVAALEAYAKAKAKGGDLSEFSVDSLSSEADKELLKMAEKRRVKNNKVAARTAAGSTGTKSRYPARTTSARPQSAASSTKKSILTKESSSSESTKKETK